MRLYMIYPNQYAVGNKPIGISMLAAVLKEAGHHFRLFDLSQYRTDDTVVDNMIGENLLEYRRVRNPEKLTPRIPITFERVLEIVCEDVANFQPDLIGLSALTDDYARGLEILRHVRKHFAIPTIVGGVHATMDPEGVIKEASVDMVCVGEGEAVVQELAAKMDRGEPLHETKNLWVKSKGEVYRNDVRPLIQNLDYLPYPDWSIFPDTAFVKPYDGVAYVYGDFELSRGCVHKCSYCINVNYQSLYNGKGKYHREKSVSRAMDEIVHMKGRHGIEFIKFWDETFLLMSLDRLEKLAEEYSRRVGLPFVIETTAETVSPRSVAALKKMGCVSVSIGVETGDFETRKEILGKPIPNDKYERCFRLLKHAGIRTSAFIMLGLPYETREKIFHTIDIIRRFKPDSQAVGIFYPYRGTPLYERCRVQGLLDDSEVVAAESSCRPVSLTSGSTVLKNASLDARELVRLRETFALYVELPKWLFPVIDMCGQDSDFSRVLTRALGEVAYKKRFEGLSLCEEHVSATDGSQ